MRKFYANNDFEVDLVNQYFDFHDMESPIKQFIDDRYYTPLSIDSKAYTDIYVMASEA